MTGETILFVDDEEHLRLAAEQALQLADLPVTCLAQAEKALARISRNFPGILVTDIRMPGMDGIELMRRALEIDSEFPVILVTGHGDVELAVQCMREGAYDFLEKPYAPSRLVETVRRALDKRRLTLENRALRSQVGGRDAIEARLTGRSAAMVDMRHQIRAIAATEADVLIIGATGTGKEVAARALHRASTRGDWPFVHINCAALPEALIESELFGHEAGAFPGATRARYGKFEHGRGGTVFLDEIESMPQPMQAKLLHAIQNRAITRLGSNDPVELDVRFVAASKTDLEAEAAAGRFRSDLLYRLNVVTLRVPDLTERREDIPRLFVQLVNEAAARYKRPAPDVPGAVLNAVSARTWPGNVRELRNAADRFALGLDLAIGDGAVGATPVEGRANLSDKVADFERALIAASLTAHGGSLKETYEALGLSRKALYEKMQKYGLDRAAFIETEDAI
ncbi:MAG: sigma-54-dependent Fis family transcriptional regulator [Roseitalea sp.]|nr:sigma-54-dependent Fis family transcriptional regulator [Roseitalea sp.]MBO6950348.1 sigma-54-dependent Fis family transcriptional regulator [Rhizobiaceae bacterium]MBO6591663.1 sigma-54-dependent Fis family transcriptional regulator [Roseitalea sp.]MBO6599518.1 sigma-54-dependent Fis family transcriptional regulator [Roseitalea sp.]MBO6611994.1 sigma-54-dependent Fis family transcriptional regulator [Roseitalea sp.]